MIVVVGVGVAAHATDSGILLQEEVGCIVQRMLLNYIHF